MLKKAIQPDFAKASQGQAKARGSEAPAFAKATAGKPELSPEALA